jgi:hypothetical protein
MMNYPAAPKAFGTRYAFDQQSHTSEAGEVYEQTPNLLSNMLYLNLPSDKILNN